MKLKNTFVTLLGLLAMLGVLAACGGGGGDDGDGGNSLPVAINDAYTLTVGTSYAVGAPGILGNDTDSDDDELYAVRNTGPSNGILLLKDDGSFIYTPNANFYGIDTFTYWANNGSGNSNLATVNITVNLAPVSYDGNTDQAEITRLNAAEITRNVWEYGNRREIIEVVGGIIDEAGLFENPRDIPYLRIDSYCGGYAEFEFQLNENDGTFSGNVIFFEYCNDWWEEDLFLTGTVPFDGKFDQTLEKNIFSLILNFNDFDDLDSTMGDTSLTYTEGTATYISDIGKNGETITDTSNFVLLDKSFREKTYWLDNYKFTFLIMSGSENEGVKWDGRFYDHEHGFVDIETEGTLLNSNDTLTGIVYLIGKGSKAKLTFNADGSTLLEVDVDNDGEFDVASFVNLH